MKTITGRITDTFVSSKDVGIAREGEGFSNKDTGKIIIVDKVKPQQLYDYVELFEED